MFVRGQKLRRFADHVVTMARHANGVRMRRWFQDKKAGWYTVLADPQMPVTSTLLNQAHNAIERQLFALKGFHHPDGSQQAFPAGAGPPVQPDTMSASRPAGRPLWRGSRRWVITYSRPAPPSAYPHLRRLWLSDNTLHYYMRWNVEFVTEFCGI